NIYSYDCCYFIINEGKIIVKYLLMIIMSILLLTACDAAEEETDEGNDEAEEDVTPDGESESDSDVGEAMDNAVTGIVNKADGTIAHLTYISTTTAMDGDEYLQRSEERRVGKESRSRSSTERDKEQDRIGDEQIDQD